jgi:ABC-2 type transport system permease protein
VAEALHTVRRILQLWRLHAALDLGSVTQDLKTFVTYFFSDLVTNTAAVTATLLLAARFAGIGRWTQVQIVFMLGYAIIAGGVLEVFFGFNVKVISRRLGRGQLDHSLLQPQPLWVVLLTEGFNLTGLASVLPGLGLLWWALAHLPVTITPGWLLLLLINVPASAVIVLSFSFLYGSLAFWAPRAAEEVSSASLQALDQLKSFPLDGAGAGLVGGLLTFLPAGFVGWFPCRALLGLDSGPAAAFVTPAAAAVFAGLAAFAFRKGLHHYGRTGSQRYLSFGHRR